MAIATVDDIVAGLNSAQTRYYQKTFTAPKAVGAFQSGWTAAGNPAADQHPLRTPQVQVTHARVLLLGLFL